MTRDLAWFNGLAEGAAVAELTRCCNAPEWARAVVDRRPFEDRGALLAAANEAWAEVGPDSWRHAIEHHPRIGETPDDERFASTRAWSNDEQSGIAGTDDEARRRLATAQREYENRFGHIFLICATGKSAAEISGALVRRLDNDAETELRVAAEELRRIMNLRLEKLIDDESDHNARA